MELLEPLHLPNFIWDHYCNQEYIWEAYLLIWRRRNSIFSSFCLISFRFAKSSKPFKHANRNVHKLTHSTQEKNCLTVTKFVHSRSLLKLWSLKVHFLCFSVSQTKIVQCFNSWGLRCAVYCVCCLGSGKVSNLHSCDVCFIKRFL